MSDLAGASNQRTLDSEASEAALEEVVAEAIATEAAEIEADEEEDVESLDDTGPASETKRLHGGVREVKESVRNGVSVGIVEGYLSTWEPDTGGRFGVPDKFERGAWAKSLQEHRSRGNRQVRLKDHHGWTIGGFPIETMREDEIGLYGVGEINLETQGGREAYSLAKQRVLTDFSVGFVATSDKLETNLRRIFKAIILEASVIDEPANQGARILEVKNAALYRSADVQGMTVRDVERALHRSGAFSRKAARILSARLTPAAPRYDVGTLESILRELKASAREVSGSRSGDR